MCRLHCFSTLCGGWYAILRYWVRITIVVAATRDHRIKVYCELIRWINAAKLAVESSPEVSIHLSRCDRSGKSFQHNTICSNSRTIFVSHRDSTERWIACNQQRHNEIIQNSFIWNGNVFFFFFSFIRLSFVELHFPSIQEKEKKTYFFLSNFSLLN